MPGATPLLSKADAGRIGARTRWGPQRVVHLNRLEPPIAAAIRALVAADQAAKTQKTPTVSETPVGVDAGGHGNDPVAA